MEAKQCAICERTLLVGERPLRFAPDGVGRLRRRLPALPGGRARARLGEGGLADDADRAGTSAPQAAPLEPRGYLRRRSGGRRAEADRRRADPAAPVEHEQAIVEAAELFNASDARARSAGSRGASASRRSSIVPLSGRQHRGRRHGRLGDLLVPVPRHARTRRSRCGSRSAGTSSTSSRPTFPDWNAQPRGRSGLVPEIESPRTRSDRSIRYNAIVRMGGT